METIVKIGKVDIDTCGAGFYLGLLEKDELEVEVIKGQASYDDLNDPEIICIEVGGSGQVELNNWDHHGANAPNMSASKQVFIYECKFCGSTMDEDEYDDEEAGSWGFTKTDSMIVEYIDQLDTKGPKSFSKTEFPTLSDIFSGMLLTIRDPVEQFKEGMEIIRVVAWNKINPFGTIKGFDSYAKAKAENERQIAKAVDDARWDFTSKGLKLGYLETKFFGAPGALYEAGAQAVVVLNPDLNGVRKFTIAGNGIKIDAVMPILNEREHGWGGPPTGTIIGSPREGSKLSLEEVVKIVIKVL